MIVNILFIRVLYGYPERITDELLDAMAEEEKIVNYLDIPIQHCNEEILRKMNRYGSYKELKSLIEKIRRKIPDIILRTTLITGFPGETEEQFTELSEFVQEMQFDRLGCFPYSQEEGTKAAEFEGQLDDDVKFHRAEMIMNQQMLISSQKNKSFMDKELEVVVEGFDQYGECYFGRSRADAPDIDGKIFFTSEKRLNIGNYVKVKIVDTLDYDLIGEVIF